MLLPAPNTSINLDVTTMIIVGTCVTAFLGLLLLSAWAQERIRALAWWGTAYLVGGCSVAVWSIENLISPPLPFGIANALLFLACGMIWSAARIFHGQPVLWGAMAAGAAVWVAACILEDFARSIPARIILSSLIVADRCRALARATQIRFAAMAGNLRSHPAWYRVFGSHSAGDLTACRAWNRQSCERMDRCICT
jgi:hypothetical protein